MTTVDSVVVGAGITGLAAARDLAMGGASVTVLDPAPPGGKLRTTAFAGTVLDEGADAFLARVPDAVELCREVGLDGDLVAPAARRALVWSRGRRRPLPSAQVMGVPCDLDELAASGIVSDEAVRRAALDLERPLVAPGDDDVAIGPFLRERLGDEVVDRLVDPLVGGINAGDVDRLSLAATVPQLDAAARSGAPSLIEACRALRAGIDTEAPVFFAPRGGMAALAAAVEADLSRRGVAVRAGRVTALARASGAASSTGWRLTLAGGESLDAATVVLTTPAPVAGDLLAEVAPAAAGRLRSITHSHVVMVSLAVAPDALDPEPGASGFLVPRTEGHLVTACSYAGNKWPHLAPSDGAVLLRVSTGRAGDDRAARLDDATVVARVLDDLRVTAGLRGEPLAVRVTRWARALPQYRPGHLDVVAAVRAQLAALGGVEVAGADLEGLGVPACIRQGRAAARRLLAA